MKEIEKTKNWIEAFVIKLDLCPFAKHPFSKGKIHFAMETSEQTEIQLTSFWKEIERLENAAPKDISNSILIYPNGLDDFFDYLELLDLCEGLLKLQKVEDLFQIASFHPDYLFEGANADDLKNFTNRSPYPMIHILRVEEVSAAIEFYDDVDEIPRRNKITLEEIGYEKIKRMLL